MITYLRAQILRSSLILVIITGKTLPRMKRVEARRKELKALKN